MAKIIQLLNVLPRHAKPKEKSYKLADVGGLILRLHQPAGNYGEWKQSGQAVKRMGFAMTGHGFGESSARD